MSIEDEQLRRAQEAIEAFDPSTALVERKFKWPDAGGTLHDVIFMQGPLGHFPTQEFGTIIATVMRGIMDGRYGVDVMQLVRDRKKLMAASVTDALEGDAVEQMVGQWKPYIDAFLQIMQEVPDIELDIIALSLGVRRKDRKDFKERIVESPQDGGLTNDLAVDIIKVFIRQNVGPIRRFLGEQLQEIAEEFMEAIGDLETTEDDGSSGTRPSSTSPAPTPA